MLQSVLSVLGLVAALMAGAPDAAYATPPVATSDAAVAAGVRGEAPMDLPSQIARARSADAQAWATSLDDQFEALDDDPDEVELEARLAQLKSGAQQQR